MIKKIVILGMVVMLAGCQVNTKALKTTTEEPTTEELCVTIIDTYYSLEELTQAFEAEASLNVQEVFAEEKVYYLLDDNELSLKLSEILVRESYFNCIYDSGVMLITKRYKNGVEAMNSVINNNSDIYQKQQGNNFEYFHTVDGESNYYIWLQDDTYMQLNIPIEMNITLDEVIQNLTYKEMNR